MHKHQTAAERQFNRAQRLAHGLDIGQPFAASPDKLTRAVRRAAKVASKGHRKYWASGW